MGTFGSRGGGQHDGVDHDPRLRCSAVRWVADEPQPGTVEVTFTDADARLWSVIDKYPIFTTDVLGPASAYPVAVAIRVRIIEDAEPMVISIDVDGVEADGTSTFRVHSADVERRT